MATKRRYFHLNPSTNQLDAMLEEKLENETMAFTPFLKAVLVNYYSLNGGIGLDPVEQDGIVKKYPRCARKAVEGDTPKSEQVVAPKPAKAPPAAPAPAAEAVAPSVAATSAAELPAPSGDQVPRRKPPTYDELYADLLDAEF